MHPKGAFMFKSRICILHFDTNRVFDTEFTQCYKNDITIPLASYIEKNIIIYREA